MHLPEVNDMGMWLVIGLVLATVVVLGSKALTRKAFAKGRAPQSLADMHVTVQGQVSSAVFNEVWSKVGEAFSIDPRLIRPNDTLKSLSSIDSWDLGEGGDALSRWLEREQLGKPPALETMLDLAKWVESRSRETINPS